jgi:hypothetical protein
MEGNCWKITFVSGLLTILAFINLSCFSWSLFPGDFTPFTHSFSDLGVIALNPRGAIFFQLALILSGIGLFFFFWGLKCWKSDETVVKKRVKISQIYGYIASFLLLLQGVFIVLHLNISTELFMYIFGFATLFTASTLFKHPKMPKWLSIFSIVTGLVNISVFFFNPLWLSWITTFSWLLFVLFFSLRTKKAFGY